MTIKELEQWIKEYGSDIYSFCRYLAWNGAEADDLYQDTFLIATEHTGQLDEEENVKSYLLSVAVRLWHNRVRKKAWRNRIAGEVPLSAKHDADGTADEKIHPQEVFENVPEQELLLSEQKKKVRDAVNQLPDHLKTVVLLYYMQEMNTEEIGRVLSIPPGTVKSRLHQARKRLKTRLEEG